MMGVQGIAEVEVVVIQKPANRNLKSNAETPGSTPAVVAERPWDHRRGARRIGGSTPLRAHRVHRRRSRSVVDPILELIFALILSHPSS